MGRSLFAQQEVLDPVCVQKIVQRQVPEHDEHGVATVFSVLRAAFPFLRRQSAEPLNQQRTIGHELLEALIEVKTKEPVIRILSARVVRSDDRLWMREHVVEALEEQRVDYRQMTGMLMC